MQKLVALLFIFGMAVLANPTLYAQDASDAVEAVENAAEAAGDAIEETATEAAEAVQETATNVSNAVADAAEEAEEVSGFQLLKRYFIDGDWRFMTLVLVTLILGLAFCIERIITLNLATANTDRLMSSIDDHLKKGDVNGAMDVCKSTSGPAASVLYEGLANAKNGPDAVEKAIVSYGSVQMGLLEKGLVWISLFIAIAPMLGFLGTVIGMIGAFDDIAAAGDISPTVVAGGIKVALLTTVFGLFVAIVLQIFYNYIVAKIDSIVNKMEDASIALVEVMARNNTFK